MVDLQKARLESASTRSLPQEFSRKSSWKSVRESGRAAVVVPQHAAQSLTARDLAGCATQFVARFDDAFAKPPDGFFPLENVKPVTESEDLSLECEARFKAVEQG